MRRSYHPDFMEEDKVCQGFFFDNGGCSEHEWGIQPLLNSFGIHNTDVNNSEQKQINTIPENLFFKKYTEKRIPRAVLLFQTYIQYDIHNTSLLKKWLKENTDLDTDGYEWRVQDKSEWISAEWDESEFAIYVAGAENTRMLEEIYNAMMKKNAAIYIARSRSKRTFDNKYGGLTIQII